MPDEELANTRGEAGVVKVGDTVRRRAGPWTPTVHALLDYLHQSGFDFAPRPLGIDEAGREILTYIEGETQTSPVPDQVWFDALPDAARRLRQLHDLTANFVAPDWAVWKGPPYADLSQLKRSSSTSDDNVICHGDWGKHNAVFRKGRLVGMIDWEWARPDSRLFDIGWCALMWCPIARADLGELASGAGPVNQPARLRELCDAYGLEDRSDVLGAIWSILETFVDWLEAGATAGDPVRTKWVAEGAAAHHRGTLAYLDDAEADFTAALS